MDGRKTFDDLTVTYLLRQVVNELKKSVADLKSEITELKADINNTIPIKISTPVLSGSYIRYPESGTDSRLTTNHIGIINPYYTTGNLNTYFFTCQCANGYANIYVRDKDGNQVTAGTNINLAGIFIKP